MLLISSILIILSIINIGRIFYDYNKAKLKYDSLRDIHIDNEYNQNYNKYIQLKNINRDYVGWIKINDTNIDYPIVKGIDNEFYLSHNFYKEIDRVGCIFMDYKNSGTKIDKNMILYGHNMKDESMFANLNNYLEEKFYDNHKFITLELLGDKYEYEIFSVYTTTNKDWISVNFNGEQSFNEYLNIINKRTVINNNKQIQNKDKILTLSSCTNRIENERVVVHAVLKNKGDN